MAQGRAEGLKVYECLRTPELRDCIVRAAAAGDPPVGAVSAKLVELLGVGAFRPMYMKHLVGLTVRDVLTEEGFKLIRRGVRLHGDPIFKAGATYARAPQRAPPGNYPLLERMLDGLSADELRWVAEYAQTRLEKIRDR